MTSSSNSPPPPELDRVLHQPVRTRVMTLLMQQGECDYVTLRNFLDLSDGVLSTHMKEFLESKYVQVKKEFVKNKPRTTYRPTQLGKQRYLEYLRTLKEILKSV